MSYCIKCGKQNSDLAKFCTGCGGSLTAKAIPSVKKNKATKWLIISAFILAGLAAGYFLLFNKSKNKPDTVVTGNISDEEVATKLKELVHQWSRALNSRNGSSVAALYAERLVYYRAQISKGNAEVLLSDFFIKNPAFSQQITGEITTEWVNDNLVVCNFNKSVTNNGSVTDFPSYLKFSLTDGIWKIVEEGDKISDYNIGKQKETADKAAILNNWIKKNIGSQVSVNLNTFNEAGIDISNYKDIMVSLGDYGEFLNVAGLKPEIKTKKNWIILSFSGNDNTIKILISSEKVFRSYHLSAGSNGASTCYNLLNRQNKDLPFTITDVNGDIITMYIDGYDNDGHYWQSGSYNINTEAITWGVIEH
ncbi:MAG: hypothetical protein SGI96_22055 [Bacteroidota bacterium]|nr:hypothetical protein [Bacteroidota bacterium]